MKFEKGMRVQSTKEALDRGIFAETKTGVVSRNTQGLLPHVAVRIDGRRTDNIYHETFWEIALDQSPASLEKQ